MQLKAVAASFDMLLEVLEKEKTAPEGAVQTKTSCLKDNTELSKQQVCSACGQPLGRDMYELPSGKLIHRNDDCLLAATGIMACVDIQLREAVAQSA
jgi:hypothetical protein